MPKANKKIRVMQHITPKMIDVVPKTEAQKDTFEAYFEGYNLLLHGVAGTGKTYISLYLAFKDIYEGMYSKIVMVRSVVPSREMGFLPGSIKEKAEIYELPYRMLINKLMGKTDSYNMLVEKGIFEFTTTSFERGIEYSDSIVIVDEIQNMTFQELDTTITRIGQNCRIILMGDLDQTDLCRKANDVTGLPKFLKIIDNMDCFDSIEFTTEDIIRSGLVKEYITAKLEYFKSEVF